MWQHLVQLRHFCQCGQGPYARTIDAMDTVISLLAFLALVSVLVGLNLWAAGDSLRTQPPRHDWYD